MTTALSPALRRAARLLAALVAAAVVSACRQAGSTQPPVGDVDRGKQAFEAYGCTACHSISSVRTARGDVGPRLDDFAGERMIAGRLPNTPENLVRWIRDPQAISPGSDMPDLGVSPDDARDIAAFLYSLR
jgi:cytochrome c